MGVKGDGRDARHSAGNQQVHQPFALDEIQLGVAIQSQFGDLVGNLLDMLLAVHIFGPRASDMIAELVTVMEFGGSAEDIGRICHAHPTLSEAVKEAALGVEGRAIHM